MKHRCEWAARADALYQAYHDKEWGVPVHGDRKLFEFLILEGAQAGLSWSTILKKRANYRKVYDRFDPRKVARYDPARARKLLKNPGIVRNRLKVRASIGNAQVYLAVRRWQADPESLETAETDSRTVASAQRHEPGPEEARLPVRRQHHLLRLHAGRRYGQ